jgi:hypothetical protein
VIDIDFDVFARQMSWERLAPGGALRLVIDDGPSLLDARDVAIQVLQRQGQLVRVEPLGAASELRALELFDDGLKPVDLPLAALDNGRHVAHQTAQNRRIGGQIIEIEPHVRFYFRVRL